MRYLKIDMFPLYLAPSVLHSRNARSLAWLAQARKDLDLAQLACRNGFLAQACYFASQAAEGYGTSSRFVLAAVPPV